LDEKNDFSDLYARYPAIIEKMPNKFTSHEFIMEFAHVNQREYIEALYVYRNSTRQGVRAPFMVVHGILAKGLRQFPKLVKYKGETYSEDIFGQNSECALWRRI
jgi:hypothetical protein